MLLLPFPMSPIIYKWTELQVTAVDTWQHPETGIANSAMFHKANTTCTVSCNLPVLRSFLCSFRNTMGIIKLHCPSPLLCLFCKLQVINYRQSRIWSRINYTLEALVKLRLPSSFTYFLNLHPSMACQNLSPQLNYWVVCGQKSNF